MSGPAQPTAGPAGLGALVVAIDFIGVPLDEWIDWYDTEHIPQRLALPGWIQGSRWMAADGSARSLGLYDLESAEVLRSPEYRGILDDAASPWTQRMHRLRDAPARPSRRHECVQLAPGQELAPADGDYLLLVTTDVDPAAEAEFNDWYDQEHLPGLSAVPGVLSGRRFLVTNASDRLRRYLATYHLRDPQVHRSPPWRQVTATPWSRAMGPALRDLEFTLYARPGLAGTVPARPSRKDPHA
jgi:hypothetical protein